jgi:enterochelin esterase-like enzyme
MSEHHISQIKQHYFLIMVLCPILFGLSACRTKQPAETVLAAAENSQMPFMAATPQPVEDIIPSTPTSTSTPLPSPTATPLPTSSLENGSVSAEWLPYDVPYTVYLPPAYNPNSVDCYPLLVLLHGQSYTEQQWLDLGIQALADDLVYQGRRPFLIVMPHESYYLQEMDESLYNKAIGEALMPDLLKKYPICEERTTHAIGGISRGAAWAVHIGFEYPELFGAIGAHSLPPHRNDVFKVADWVKGIPAGQNMAFYIDIGAYDRYVEPAQLFESYLVKYHVQHEFHLNDGMHEDAYWQQHLPEYLNWYSSLWNVPNSSY